MRKKLLLLAAITALAPCVATAQSVQLDISGGFNMDAICGPVEFQEVLIDGTDDYVGLFGDTDDGNGNFILYTNWFMIANSTGTSLAYSITGYAPGHPLNYSGTQGLPEDGVISGASMDYHMASVDCDDTLTGDWTESADPSQFDLADNCIAVGALHNSATWQVSSVTVELPTAQKGKYDDVNFLIVAQNMAHKARNMQIVALYGATGADEEILYSFATTSGGSGPLMTDTTAPTDFAIAYTMSKIMNTTSGVTGSVVDSTANLFEFDTELALDETKDLWGFRFEDTDSTLNWAARGMAVFAATATSAANVAPIADAGADQTVNDADDSGSESVTLDGSASTDSDGSIVSYIWEENSSQIATGVSPSVSLNQGVHTITLTVTDDDSDTDTDTVQITVNDPPAANAGADQKVNDTDGDGSETVTLDGSDSTDNGTIASYVWAENSSQIAAGSTANVLLGVGSHTITLTVTDDNNATDTDTVVVDVTAPGTPVQIDLSAGFNIDAICGPVEFQECLLDGANDYVALFGTTADGNGEFTLAQNKFMIANSNGDSLAYSITGYAYGHPLNYSGTQGLPADGVISGADVDYHMASVACDDTLVGDYTESADPSNYDLNDNCIVIGALHNSATWQVTSVTVELPAGQKGKYGSVNFLLAAQAMAHKARNMQVVALYGATGADEEILYSFATTSGGSGPLMTDTTAPTDFAIVYSMSKIMDTPSGLTGAVLDGTANLFEFSSAKALDDTKDLWGFRFEDSDSTLNWAARGLTIFAATVTTPDASNIPPTANAGSDQVVTDSDDSGSESVSLDGSASTDSDGSIVSYVWEENSSQIATGAQPSVTLAQGVHTITLTVTDDDNDSDSDTVQITVNDPPVADAGTPQTVVDTDDNGSESVTLDGTGSTDSDGTISSYVWSENSSQIATGAQPSVTLNVGSHTITLTVTDNDSGTDTDTVLVTIDEPSRPVQLDISAYFNQDAWCGPKEYQECRLDGSQDLIQLFGNLDDGNAQHIADLNWYLAVNTSGSGMEYSITGDAGHPAYLSGTEGTPADGVISGADRDYHVAGSTGNTTLSGDWTQVSDPSTYNVLSNCLYVGAAHNKADWQTSSVTIELPAAQKDQYDNVNFAIAAADVSDKARNIRISALYGDGTDAAVLYNFSTADGGSGPLMTDSTATGFASVYATSKAYNSGSGTTGAIADKTVRFWEFSSSLELNTGKTLYGFKIEDVDPSLNWNARGLVVFAATAMTASGANALPTAEAGAAQTVHTATGTAAVTLDGTGSTDSDGSIASYSWVANSVEIATGATPQVNLAVGVHTITLTVTDNDSGTATDTVTITVNESPIAEAGDPQTVYDDDSTGAESVTLAGGASTDDGSIVSYVWTENSSQIATGTNQSVSLSVGVHTVTLTVTDNLGGTDTDTVVITVSDNHPPVANAGADQTVTDTNGDGSESVSLSGLASTDAEGTISSYAWYDYDGTLLSTSSAPTLTMSLGINDVKLVVTDSDGATDSAVVRVWVIPAATYWVDQNDPNASDSNDGSAANPWLTVGYAVDQVSAGDVIMVKEGVYRETPTFGASGSSGNEITLMGYPGDRVVISGADEITGWTQCTQTIAKNNTNYANIYYVDITWKPTRLVQDDVELDIAATPWMGWYLAEDGTNSTLVDTTNLTQADDYWNGATVFLWDMSGTVQYSKEVTDFDSATGTLTISGTWTSNTDIVVEADADIYQLQNKVELIAAAGQWAVEDIGGGSYRLYAWATGGGDPDNYVMEGSKQDRFVLDWAGGSYWIIDNLEIRHGTNYGMGTWTGTNAGHITVQNCIVHSNDSTGINGQHNVYGVYHRNVIMGNSVGITNSGESNVDITDSEIAWNTIDGVRTIGPNNGIDWAEYVTLKRNYIHDHYRWSHADNCQSYGDIRYLDVEDNLILSAGQSFMMEGTEEVDVTNNTIIGCQAVQLIFGHSTVKNAKTDYNTQAFGGLQLINHSGDDGYTHTNNIMVKGNEGLIWGGVDSTTTYTSDYNVFYIGEDLTYNPITWPGESTFSGYVTASGEDTHSTVADPMFANAPAYYSGLDTHKQHLFTSTKVYIPTGNIDLFEVGDKIEIDWDSVVRTITSVGTNYVEFTPGDTRIAYKSNQITNWKDKTDFTLDFTLKSGSPAIGAASDGSSDIGSSIDIEQYRNCDFNGDGRRDIVELPGN